MSNPAQRTAATEQAYLTIRSDILSGALKEGERITEQRLAESLGLSRTPVREAISKLIHEGFVERGTGYTTRVAHFEDEELEQMFQIRKLLESYGAARAAEFATKEQIELLRQLSAEMSAHTPPRSQATTRSSPPPTRSFTGPSWRLHARRASAPLISMAINVGMVARMYHLYADEDLIRSAAHHHEITDAIAARAPEWAASVMSSHLLAAASMATKAGEKKVPAASTELQDTQPAALRKKASAKHKTLQRAQRAPALVMVGAFPVNSTDGMNVIPRTISVVISSSTLTSDCADRLPLCCMPSPISRTTSGADANFV